MTWQMPCPKRDSRTNSNQLETGSVKLLFLPPQPLLTKKGTVRKRARGRTPGRVFLEDGRELTNVAAVSVESGPGMVFVDGGVLRTKYRICTIHLELRDPQVEIIDRAPTGKTA